MCVTIMCVFSSSEELLKTVQNFKVLSGHYTVSVELKSFFSNASTE